MSDINDPATPHDLNPFPRPGEYPEQASIEEMAQKLAPLRGVHGGKSASPLLKPVETAKRTNYATVNDALAALIPKLADVNAQALGLRQRLTATTGRDKPEQNLSQQVPEDGSIFDHLAYQALVLARLVSDLDEAVQACQDAVR